MRTRHWLRVAGLTGMTAVLICGLTAQQRAADGRIVNERIVSERTDPGTGARWVLMRDAEHPAALAHWVLVEAGKERAAGAGAEATGEKLMIHAGDKIVVEEQTSVMRAWLEATALTSAGTGGELRARLAIGGRVLAVRAIAPNTAEMEEETR
ncbi:hypothetical protein [Terracidiphilus gabretensis]|uniref:hypothetical protein n=1 Tax=Terracidiphilus gabretensis TaxID=1577687 RepID=UPI0012F85F03|nr:hypothetical protein [Terracidiphilus gabretensis]